jgi:hypothetical protein
MGRYARAFLCEKKCGILNIILNEKSYDDIA